MRTGRKECVDAAVHGLRPHAVTASGQVDGLVGIFKHSGV